jgi:hypothetical protein
MARQLSCAANDPEQQASMLYVVGLRDDARPVCCCEWVRYWSKYGSTVERGGVRGARESKRGVRGAERTTREPAPRPFHPREPSSSTSRTTYVAPPPRQV